MSDDGDMMEKVGENGMSLRKRGKWAGPWEQIGAGQENGIEVGWGKWAGLGEVGWARVGLGEVGWARVVC
ncbi:hypothetical protein U1Q18_006476 [Sarracenia purpurea var. burkii]